MKYSYAVLGAGRQGTAAAYDLVKHAEAKQVLIIDYNENSAVQSANRINELLATSVVTGRSLDVKNTNALVALLKDVDVLLSAVPYYLNLPIVEAAIQSGTSMCDLGGNTDIVFQELDLNEAAEAAGVTIVPDCGMVPGLGTSVCMRSMELVEGPEEVYLWDGGLPQNPVEPWNYILTFHFEGLVNEYFGTTEFLRDGKLISMRCFEEYELVSFPPPIGELEAFTSAGGTSTAPRTFLNRLRVYQNKTLRYKGHFAQWKAFHDAGLLEDQEVIVDGKKIRPRDLLAAVLDPKIRAKAGEKDVCIIRALCKGKHSSAVVDLYDYYDESTGFTAMERTTGWHLAIVASMIAHGEIPAGGIPVELAVPGHRMMAECEKRGMIVETRVEKN